MSFFLFRARMDYVEREAASGAVAINKEPTKSHLPTHGKQKSLQTPSSVVSLSLCHEPHVAENLPLYLLPGLHSPLRPSSSLALPTQAELNPQTAAIGPLSLI